MTDTGSTARYYKEGSPKIRVPASLPAWPPRDEEIENELQIVFESGEWSFEAGGYQEAFGREFATAHGAKHGYFTTNGTTAIVAALVSIGVTSGDEVILSGFTCPTTIMSIQLLGAKPVFVDIDSATLCMRPDATRSAVTPKTKALLVIHMYSSLCDLDAILDIAKAHDLFVVEDCAHAPGAEWNHQSVGSLGDVGCFSFHKNKLISSGEGGMVVTSDDEIAARLRRFIHAGKPNDWVPRQEINLSAQMITNAAASSFQAAVARVQARRLRRRLLVYQENFEALRSRVAEIPGVRLQETYSSVTSRSFNKVCMIFDCDALGETELEEILSAAKADGLPLRRTYGAAYLDARVRGNLAIHSKVKTICPNTERLAANRTATLPHWWLGGDIDCIEFVATVLRNLPSRVAAAS